MKEEEPKTIEPDAVNVVTPVFDHEMITMTSCWQLMLEHDQVTRGRILRWLTSKNSESTDNDI